MDQSPKEKVESLCKELGLPDPIGFLTQIMSGTDPRTVAQVYLKTMAMVEEYGDEPPDAWDWLELVEMIQESYRGSIVNIKQSQEAAKQLMEYMHPKRKAIEVTQEVKSVAAEKLSRLELRRLKKAFDLDY